MSAFILWISPDGLQTPKKQLIDSPTAYGRREASGEPFFKIGVHGNEDVICLTHRRRDALAEAVPKLLQQPADRLPVASKFMPSSIDGRRMSLVLCSTHILQRGSQKRMRPSPRSYIHIGPLILRSDSREAFPLQPIQALAFARMTDNWRAT
jgi:hypothetical protein